MAKTLDYAAANAPRVSPGDLRRFNKVVTIRDPVGFRKELDALLRDKTLPSRSGATTAALARTLREKAGALQAENAWAPSATDIQRGRALMLREFTQPQNLPLAEFAKLAHKSRQQIYKDIVARRLLALSVGVRGQRLPDWQLDPTRLKLTQEVLARAHDVDAWTLFHTLSEPLDGLQGRSPLKTVRPGNLAGVVKAVLNALSIHVPSTAVERG
jgi:hypothetical protein